MTTKGRNTSIGRDVRRKISRFAASDSIVQKWEDSAYGEIQRITNPTKGRLAESLVAEWLEDLGYLSEEHGYDRRRGEDNFDNLVLIDDKLVQIEVKMATQDSSNKYQFNWIRVDHDVALVVFLAVDPDSIYLAVKTRQEMQDYIHNPNPPRGQKLTPVPKSDSTSHVKWTASKESMGLVEIKTYGDIADVFHEAVGRYRRERDELV